MAVEERAPGATELIYLPAPTWAPAFTALGITLALVGLFAGWVWSAIGAIFFFVAVGSWIRRVREEFSRLPREQRSLTAIVPAVVEVPRSDR